MLPDSIYDQLHNPYEFTFTHGTASMSGVFTVTRTSPLTRESVAIFLICAKTFFYIFALLR